MNYKRYGGKFQFSGSGSSYVALVGFVLLIGFSMLAVALNKPWLIIAGFLLLFVFGAISALFSGGQLSDVKKQIFQDRIAAAIVEYSNENYSESAKLFEIAARYFPLPEREAEIYRNCKERASSQGY